MTREASEPLCLDPSQAQRYQRSLPSSPAVRDAADRAKAFADPTRLRIATALAAGGELCVCDIAWACELAENLVSHHVRILREMGAAESRRDGRLVMYRLSATGRRLFAAFVPDVIALRDVPSTSGHSEATSTARRPERQVPTTAARELLHGQRHLTCDRQT